MRTLVWAMFGMGDSGSTNIESEAQNSFKLRPDIIANIGSILFMVFVFATAVVLMNLLIAMMANTFQEIQDEREVEWKFGRTELWLNFIEPGSAIPPPLNLIPSTLSIGSACTWLYKKCIAPPEDTVLIEKRDIKDNDRKGVLSRLVRRYVRKEERDKLEEEEDSTKDDILRRTLDRMTTKLEKRLDHMDQQIEFLGRDLRNVIERQTSMTEELQRVV